MTSLNIEGDFGELDRMIQGLSVAARYFDSSQAMSPAVRAAGAGWYDNFRKEGARVGGWKPLKEFTIREREARGYRSGPKLFQSGNLERGAIRPFVNWQENQSGTEQHIAPTPARARARQGGFTSDSLDLMESGPTWVTGRVLPRTFSVSVAGAKALNQTGGNLPSVSRVGGWTNVPARPFWFFDSPMMDEAARGVLDRFQFYSFRYLPRVTGLDTRTWR